MTTFRPRIRRRKLLALLLVLALPVGVGACDTVKELLEIEDEAVAEDDARLGDHPLVGQWETGSQGCNPSSALVIRADGTGTMYVFDCNGVCPASEITFDWEASGTESGSLTLDYTSSKICGEPQSVPDPDSSSFSVSGNELRFAGATWDRVG